MIVGFRNQLAHDYAAINDAVVWAIASNDVAMLSSSSDAGGLAWLRSAKEMAAAAAPEADTNRE